MNLKSSSQSTYSVANGAQVGANTPASEVEHFLQEVRDELQAVQNMLDNLENNMASCLSPSLPQEDGCTESLRRTASSNLGATLDGFYWSLVNIKAHILDLNNRCQL